MSKNFPLGFPMILTSSVKKNDKTIYTFSLQKKIQKTNPIIYSLLIINFVAIYRSKSLATQIFIARLQGMERASGTNKHVRPGSAKDPKSTCDSLWGMVSEGALGQGVSESPALSWVAACSPIPHGAAGGKTNRGDILWQ